MQLWISIIANKYEIHNSVMDIFIMFICDVLMFIIMHICNMDIHNSIINVYTCNSILDIHNTINYNHDMIMDIHNHNTIMDIHTNYEYPKFEGLFTFGFLYILYNSTWLNCKKKILPNIKYKAHLSTAGNKLVDHSDVVGALPVAAAPTTSSFSTKLT